MQKVRDAFRDAKREFERGREPALACDVGVYGGCAMLTLQKPSWRNDGPRRVPNEAGIFFSVWVTAEDAKRDKANYNIHVLKLRQLSGYRIASRDFAADFRAGFAKVQEGWPNARVDYGPQTLMQGWIDMEASHFAGDVLALMQRFEEISPVIDQMLARRVAASGRTPATA